MNSAFLFNAHLIAIDLSKRLLPRSGHQLSRYCLMLEASPLRDPAHLKLVALVLLHVLVAQVEHFCDVNQAFLNGELAEVLLLQLGLDGLFSLAHCAGRVSLHNQLIGMRWSVLTKQCPEGFIMKRLKPVLSWFPKMIETPSGR